MPLLTLTLGVRTATPLVALTLFATIVVLLWRTRRHLDASSARRLVASSALGLPVGLVWLRAAPGPIVETALGVLLIAVGLHGLVRPRLPHLRSEN